MSNQATINEIEIIGPLDEGQTIALSVCPQHGLHVKVLEMQLNVRKEGDVVIPMADFVEVSDRQQGYDSGGFLFDPNHLSPNAKAKVR